MMMAQHNLFKWIYIAGALVVLSACGEKTSVVPATPVKPQVKKADSAKAVSGKVEEVASPVQTPPVKYVYITENRRDPFQPFQLIRRPVDAGADLSAQTPLQQYDTLQYKLAAVIVGYGQPMVMVIAPDGKSHVVRKGMKIGKNRGVVVEINKDGFFVEEKYRDLSDVIRTNILEIKLPKREGV